METSNKYEALHLNPEIANNGERWVYELNLQI